MEKSDFDSLVKVLPNKVLILLGARRVGKTELIKII
jgi:predicted AAA+ superfamily ATPase